MKVEKTITRGETTATLYADGKILFVTKNAAHPQGLFGPVVAGEHRMVFKPGQAGYGDARSWMDAHRR
jgi:hypothetical protein